jgi:hypothetical protein
MNEKQTKLNNSQSYKDSLLKKNYENSNFLIGKRFYDKRIRPMEIAQKRFDSFQKEFIKREGIPDTSKTRPSFTEMSFTKDNMSKQSTFD